MIGYLFVWAKTSVKSDIVCDYFQTASVYFCLFLFACLFILMAVVANISTAFSEIEVKKKTTKKTTLNWIMNKENLFEAHTFEYKSQKYWDKLNWNKDVVL